MRRRTRSSGWGLRPKDRTDPIWTRSSSRRKFIGGPSTPGVLAGRCEFFRNRVPDMTRGGAVAYVNPTEHSYVADVEPREESGRPAIVVSICAGLCSRSRRRSVLVGSAGGRSPSSAERSNAGAAIPTSRSSVIPISTHGVPWCSYLERARARPTRSCGLEIEVRRPRYRDLGQGEECSPRYGSIGWGLLAGAFGAATSNGRSLRCMTWWETLP